MIYGKKIIIYGGAGWLGSRMVPSLGAFNEISVFSRDEAKHHNLRLKCPSVKFINGDVSNFDEVLDATKGHDISINLAALKEIDTATAYPMRAINTICIGAQNTKRAAEQLGLETACLISSDKACAPTLAYGACKSLAESIYINNNEKSNTNYFVCRYGNVAASRGSIIDVLNNTDKKLTLYSELATRFTITVDKAIELILFCLESTNSVYKNSIIIPKLKSYLIKDLFEIYKDEFGRAYQHGFLRAGEKLHESMFSQEESPRIENAKEYFALKSHANTFSRNIS